MVEPSTPTAGEGPCDPTAGALPAHIGPFRILERIGAGGMGVVYLGERREPIEQRAALKVIRTDRLDRTYRARFAMEQTALARMDHPNIARLLDAGDSEGQSWFAMEYVPGTPLSDYCREHRLSIDARLHLFAQICDGVQHAHMKGILHRDLKPGNILVREVDGRPIAKIIDFGLAQPVDPLQIRATLHESMRQIVGTFAYMSPEQAERTEGDLDTRTDVYSLGVLLYEMLTGLVPLDLEAAERRGLAWIAEFLREHEPKKPSTRLSTMGERLSTTAAERATSPQRLRASVRGDLDWVTMKALARDRQHRYATVRDLGREVERVLRHEPVEAGPPGGWYVAKKWVRRHARGVVVGTSLLLLVGVLSIWDALRTAEARAAEARRTLLAKVALVADYITRAEDTLWPADGRAVDAISGWLAEVAHLNDLRADVLDLLREVQEELAGPRGSTSAAAVLRWQVGHLQKGLVDLDRLVRLQAVVAARLLRARTLHERSIDAHGEAWRELGALLRRDGRFSGFPTVPIEGLVPLGLNAYSKLPEFYHLDSAVGSDLPGKREQGTYEVKAETGLIFVLVPGGTFEIPADVSGQPKSVRRDLAPYLLSRYEMTQAQWARMMGEGVSSPRELARSYNIANEPEGLQRVAGGVGYPASAENEDSWDPVTWTHPLQQVTWDEAKRRLPRWNLGLPTSAQWLRAASGRTDTQIRLDWPSSAFGKFVNFNDEWRQSVRKGQTPSAAFPSAVCDGFALTSPVGALASNDFGFHDIFGNVAEWCLDGFDNTILETANGPNQVMWDAVKCRRALRHGHSFLTPLPAEFGAYRQEPTGNMSLEIGVRPVFLIP